MRAQVHIIDEGIRKAIKNNLIISNRISDNCKPMLQVAIVDYQSVFSIDIVFYYNKFNLVISK